MQVSPKNPGMNLQGWRKRAYTDSDIVWWHESLLQDQSIQDTQLSVSFLKAEPKPCLSSHSSDKPRGKGKQRTLLHLADWCLHAMKEISHIYTLLTAFPLDLCQEEKAVFLKSHAASANRFFFLWELTRLHISVLAVVIRTSEMVGGPCLGTFKARLDGSLRNLMNLNMSLLIAGGWTTPLKVPSNPILWFYHVQKKKKKTGKAAFHECLTCLCQGVSIKTEEQPLNLGAECSLCLGKQRDANGGKAEWIITEALWSGNNILMRHAGTAK